MFPFFYASILPNSHPLIKGLASTLFNRTFHYFHLMNQTFKHFYNSTGISTDTRNIERNCLFVCIKGDNFDGNTFATKALEAGASHVIVDNKDFYQDNGKMSLVNDSVQFIQDLANHHRKKFNIPVIGITGSNGKTTTKELVNTVLSKKFNVLATIGNLNNHLGVPFTLLRMTEKHDIAIIEMGANKFKDIEELCQIAEPTHGIITNIGRAHLEGFKDLEGVIKTKKELFDSIENSNGTIFINADDETLTEILPKNTEHFSYGALNKADTNGELVSLSPFVEMTWSDENNTSNILSTQMVGKYNFYNYLAAACIGKAFNVTNKDISAAIMEYNPSNGRSQVKKTNQNTLILDCYNANPTSMKSAIESFASTKSDSKLCIIGDMKELGDESIVEHRKIISLLEDLKINTWTVGEEFKKINSPILENQFVSSLEASEFISKNPITNSLILLKGSRSIGLEVLEAQL